MGRRTNGLRWADLVISTTETDPRPKHFSSDRLGLRRVPPRFIADLEEVAGYPPIVAVKAAVVDDAQSRRIRHRNRQMELEPPPESSSVQRARVAIGHC
jgi:hypothetical protein